ncbi:MAG: hypothetical protein ABFS10_11420 [Bacteroidota bacterium]
MKIPTYLLLCCVILFSSCEKQNESNKEEIYQGRIVGYLKCSDSNLENKTLLGIFIISNSMDSLLSFNIPSSISDMVTSELQYGIGFINGDSVSFSFRNADKNEMNYFDCPPSTMQDITFYPIENFAQVIITNISKINIK